MIDRFILIKLDEPSQREQVAARIQREFSDVPGMTELRVGVPADDASLKSWDVSLVLSCPDAASLAEVLASAPAVRCLETLARLAGCIKAWSFARQ